MNFRQKALNDENRICQSLDRPSRAILGHSQREALIDTGCDPDHLYSDSISGTKWSRPGISDALDYMRTGDTLVVTRLDRLGRNMHETVTTIADLATREINLHVLDPALDTLKPADKVGQCHGLIG